MVFSSFSGELPGREKFPQQLAAPWHIFTGKHRVGNRGEPSAGISPSSQQFPGAGWQARTSCLAPPLPVRLTWAQRAVKPGDPGCRFTFLQGQASASLGHSDRSKGRSGLARPRVPISKGSTSAHGSATTCARRRTRRGRAAGPGGAGPGRAGPDAPSAESLLC